MSNPHIGSNLILLLDNLDGATPEPVLEAADITGLADLRGLYSTLIGMTPESTIKSESEDIEYIGQADDGSVGLAEILTASPKLQLDVDSKDLNSVLWEKYLGPTGSSLDPAKTYKAWLFWAVCSRANRLTFEAGTISAVRIIRAACSYSVKGDVASNGKELSNMKIMITVDLSKASTNVTSIDTASGV